MNERRLFAGLGLLAVVLAVATLYGVPVSLKTGSLNPGAPPGQVGCYTSGTSGQLVDDPSGTAIIEGPTGRRVVVTWPIGWTARRTLLGTQIVDGRGVTVARTGTQVYLMGGYWLDDSFLTCGPAPL